MMKRGREEECDVLHLPQQARHEVRVKRCRDTPLAGESAAGNGRVSGEKVIRPEPDAKWVPREAAPALVAAADGPEGSAGWDASCSAAVPRWWQLWVGRGGGMVVDCEELLWGWFPFVDEDFSADGEKAGWLSIWTHEVEVPPQDDIWHLKQVNQIPSRSN